MKELNEQELSEVSGGKQFCGKEYPEGPAPIQGLLPMDPYEGPNYYGRHVYVVYKKNNEKWAYGILRKSYEKKNCTYGSASKRKQGVDLEIVSYKLRSLGGDSTYDYDWPKIGMYYEFYDGHHGVVQLYLAD